MVWEELKIGGEFAIIAFDTPQVKGKERMQRHNLRLANVIHVGLLQLVQAIQSSIKYLQVVVTLVILNVMHSPVA